MTKSQARKINWPANSMEWNVKKKSKKNFRIFIINSIYDAQIV